MLFFSGCKYIKTEQSSAELNPPGALNQISVYSEGNQRKIASKICISSSGCGVYKQIVPGFVFQWCHALLLSIGKECHSPQHQWNHGASQMVVRTMGQAVRKSRWSGSFTLNTRTLGEEIDNINSDFMKWAPFFKKKNKIPSSLPLATLTVLLGKLRNADELKIQLSEKETLRWHSGLSPCEGLLWNRAGQRPDSICSVTSLFPFWKRNRPERVLFCFLFVFFLFSFLF